MTQEIQPEIWLDEYGDYLFRFALLRINDQHLAEDLVQDTFLSAIKAYPSFSGRSSVKTWLVTILRNKIIDYYRKASRREVHLDAHGDDNSGDYEENGIWNLAQAPHDWGNHPEEALHQSEFFQVLKNCIAHLPEKIAHVFTLRHIDGYEADEVCKELEITSSNLWVMLHRARAQLRKCIDNNWFAKDG